MIHLSARLAWHDTGWNGCVCQEPHLNASCITVQNIRDSKNDELERIHSGTPVIDLDGWHPPCTRDINSYSPNSFSIEHSDPLGRNFLSPVKEEIPPYSVLPAPYRWLLESSFRDICEAENLSIRGPEDKKKTRGWIYDPDRQRALLNQFWGKLKEGEGKSLVFYYAKGNPVDENVPRLILGVGRIKKIGPQLYFEGTDDSGEPFPIWTRSVKQDYPSQGFRLPYQEYLREGFDPRPFACYIPTGSLLQFSYVAEHISDDQAVGILERLIQSVETIKTEGKVFGPWTTHLNWLNDCLSEVWIDRGPFPGIGSVLQYLGCVRGTSFQRNVLKGFIKQNRNPWDYVKGILEGKVTPTDEFVRDFDNACSKWQKLGVRTIRQELLEVLVRFELTQAQVNRLMDLDERKKAGMDISDEQLISNPYMICENDLGTLKSDPISLDSIDRGMLPQDDAALFIAPENRVLQDDMRRVRATSVEILNECAEEGDTVLSLSDHLINVRERYPERRSCRPDRELFISESDFYSHNLWLSLEEDPQLVALNRIHNLESYITQIIKRRVRRQNPSPDPPIDWKSALINEFGEPISDREKSAVEEKAIALETLYHQRISILTGSAGTGKTSALKIFLNCLDENEGRNSVYLLAPTGKARVRLSTKTQRNAYTIHQLLLKLGWLIPDIFLLKTDGGSQDSAPTVIIDECSMVPTDLLGVLFKAVNLDMVRRLILVGDPNQLPPIGPGRPFMDIINWLQSEHPDCVATLRTTMRTTVSQSATVDSIALLFADGYKADMTNPADDEILSWIAKGETRGDLLVHYWNGLDELLDVIKKCMQDLLGIGEGDYRSFNKSLGITENLSKQPDWRGADNWQILSPLRTKGIGTDELNRMIQFAFREGLIRKAQQPWSKAKPFGEHQIVWSDKVIQTVNRRREAWPRESQNLNYIANGEIGIVTNTYRNAYGPFLQVGFSTQDGVTYRYYRNQVEEEIELAYALTVHKAQGSDFEIVFLIIPQEAQTLCRELIYTGLTRFRRNLVLLIEGDTGVLERLRLPEQSATYLRNTNMFTLSIRTEEEGIPFPEGLIHLTAKGIPVRSKSEVIVADTLDRLGVSWEYEKKVSLPSDPNNFRLPDFTIGFEGDILYWEHLGMLTVPAYRDGWDRKRKWYEDELGIPVVGDGGLEGPDISPGSFPVVITSRDNEDGGIDVPHLESLAKKYILLEG